MYSTTLSTIVGLPPDEAWAKFREYAYRRTIGRGCSVDAMVLWHPSDDAAVDGAAEFRVADGGTQVTLSLACERDELAVVRYYRRYLDGFARFAAGARPEAVERQLPRAA
jgi:hypothetical protein